MRLVDTIHRREMLALTPASLLLAATPLDGALSPDAFGARGNGRTDDTAAVQRAIDAAARAGGGRVRLTPGRRYRTGTIELKSGVTLDVAGGATLLATTDRAAYRTRGALIYAEGAQDIAVVGTGTIEGNGTAWFPTLVEGAYDVPDAFLGYWNPLDEFPGDFAPTGRPRMMLLVDCRRVRLRDVRFHDAPTWTIHPVGCEDVSIVGITIDNSLLVPNCDGIDIDRCRRVRIADCAITAGDDCVVVKTSRNFRRFGDCTDVTVSNCTLRSSSAGVKIEPEGLGTVGQITVTGCTITDSNRGIAMFQRDGATVEDVIVADCVITTRQHHPMWWGAAEAVNVSNLPRRADMAAGTIRNVLFTQLLCRGEAGLFVHGWPGSPLADVTFSDVQVSIERRGGLPGGQFDLRPTDVTPALVKHAIPGVYARYAQRLRLRDVDVRFAAGLPDYYGAAIEVEAVENLVLDGVTGDAAKSGAPALLLDAATRRTLRQR